MRLSVWLVLLSLTVCTLNNSADRCDCLPVKSLLSSSTTLVTSCATVYRMHPVSGVLTAGSVARVRVSHQRCVCVQLVQRCMSGSVMRVLTVESLYPNRQTVADPYRWTGICTSLTPRCLHRCAMRLWVHVRHPRQCVTD